MNEERAAQIRRIALERHGESVGRDDIMVPNVPPQAATDVDGTMGYWVTASLWVPKDWVTPEALLRNFLVEELSKLDGKSLDDSEDVDSVAETLARALEARAQKTVCESCGSSYRKTVEET